MNSTTAPKRMICHGGEFTIDNSHRHGEPFDFGLDADADEPKIIKLGEDDDEATETTS